MDPNGLKVVCTYKSMDSEPECGTQLERAKGKKSTSGMSSHLKSQHQIVLKDLPSDERQSDIRAFVPKIDKSQDAIISRLIALDGLSFYQVANSEDLRMMLTSFAGKPSPKCPNAIRKRMFEYKIQV